MAFRGAGGPPTRLPVPSYGVPAGHNPKLVRTVRFETETDAVDPGKRRSSGDRKRACREKDVSRVHRDVPSDTDKDSSSEEHRASGGVPLESFFKDVAKAVDEIKHGVFGPGRAPGPGRPHGGCQRPCI